MDGLDVVGSARIIPYTVKHRQLEVKPCLIWSEVLSFNGRLWRGILNEVSGLEFKRKLARIC